jgi:hypothetical protein
MADDFRDPAGKFISRPPFAHERWAKGKSANPGGNRKLKHEFMMLARESAPKALERARQILDDDDQEWRAWMDAARFVVSYGFGAPPKITDPVDEKTGPDPIEELKADELRALARQSLADDAGHDADDDSDDTEH